MIITLAAYAWACDEWKPSLRRSHADKDAATAAAPRPGVHDRADVAGLTFITMLAYDYRYAFAAIGSYYELADEIILGLDRDRLTWMRQAFTIDMDEVHAFIAALDKERKIRIVEGDFHAADHPMANDALERSALSVQAAPGNWVVQIDADEILLNGAQFKAWLLQNDPREHNVFGRWVSVFKMFGNQALVIDPSQEVVPVATMLRAQYTAARATPQQGVLSPLHLLHFSWGRSPEQLRQKLANWGHARDFDVAGFFAFWESITLENFTQARDFHPLNGRTWRSLKRMQINGAAAPAAH